MITILTKMLSISLELQFEDPFTAQKTLKMRLINIYESINDWVAKWVTILFKRIWKRFHFEFFQSIKFRFHIWVSSRSEFWGAVCNSIFSIKMRSVFDSRVNFSFNFRTIVIKWNQLGFIRLLHSTIESHLLNRRLDLTELL